MNKSEPQPEGKATPPSDLTPQIAKRAYELYEKRGHQDGKAIQDWEQAEHEIREEHVGRGKAASNAHEYSAHLTQLVTPKE